MKRLILALLLLAVCVPLQACRSRTCCPDGYVPPCEPGTTPSGVRFMGFTIAITDPEVTQLRVDYFVEGQAEVHRRFYTLTQEGHVKERRNESELSDVYQIEFYTCNMAGATTLVKTCTVPALANDRCIYGEIASGGTIPYWDCNTLLQCHSSSTRTMENTACGD